MFNLFTENIIINLQLRLYIVFWSIIVWNILVSVIETIMNHGLTVGRKQTVMNQRLVSGITMNKMQMIRQLCHWWSAGLMLAGTF